MTHRLLKNICIAAALAVSAGVLYGNRLDYAPPHIEIDEVLIGLNAHAIASTGHDMRGEFLPLYSQTADHSWYQPAVIYLTALVLKILPLTEWSIRVPTVCIGVVDIVLIYFVARHLFGSEAYAAIAAGLLALTPAHLIHTRYGMDYLYPVPFILAWLLCLLLYAEQRRTVWLVAATSCLGVGFYSYIASMVMMPLYFLFTCLCLAWLKAPRRAFGIAAAGFVPFLLPFVVWIATHQTAYGATIVKYGLYDADRLGAVQGLQSLIGYQGVSQRLSQYWNYFNPALLFFGSGIKVMFSTSLAGVFLFPVAVFLVAGIYQALKPPVSPIKVLVFLGFVTAPLAALIPADEASIFRALAILPFGVLLATLGFQYFWSTVAKPFTFSHPAVAGATLVIGVLYAAWTLATHGRLGRSGVAIVGLGLSLVLVGLSRDRTRQWRIAAACLLALMPVQFGFFWSDYFSDYRIRSSSWLGGNIRGALEAIIDRAQSEPAASIYFSPLKASSGQLDGRNPYMDGYWKFYLAKHTREDLLARTRPFDPALVREVPPGSLVLTNEGDRTTEALVARGELRRVTTIAELDGQTFFVILQR